MPLVIKMFDLIEKWLRERSVAVEQHGAELRFKHSENRSSILVGQIESQCGLIASKCSLLSGFYKQCVGASIGNGHIIIATPIPGGVDLSHGFRLPDLEELRHQAAELGMNHAVESEAFMMEASWLFIYGVTPNSGRLVRFDREFGSYESISSIENVLNDWWQIVAADG